MEVFNAGLDFFVWIDFDAVNEGSFEGDFIIVVVVIADENVDDVVAAASAADPVAVCLELSLTILEEDGGRMRAVLAKDEGTSSPGRMSKVKCQVTSSARGTTMRPD